MTFALCCSLDDTGFGGLGGGGRGGGVLTATSHSLSGGHYNYKVRESSCLFSDSPLASAMAS